MKGSVTPVNGARPELPAMMIHACKPIATASPAASSISIGYDVK